MKTINKIIAGILIVTFGFSNIAFAAEPDSFKLSPPSSFSNMQGEEFRESAQIMLGILSALKPLKAFDADSLRSLGHVSFAEKTVFTQNRVAGTILFNELEEFAVKSKDSVMVERGSFLVKTLIMEKVYYGLITPKSESPGYDVSVVPERLVNQALESGFVKFAHSSVNKDDKAAIDNYIEHETSPEGGESVDEWIRARMLAGRYVVRTESPGMNLLYVNARKVIHGGVLNYEPMMRRISDLLSEVGVADDNRYSIISAVSSRSLVFIPYEDENELPAVTIDGNKMRVTAHTSPYAVYIFMPKALHEQVILKDLWSEEVREYIEAKLIHEIGAMCGLEPMVFDGEVRNLLDSIVTTRRYWDGPFYPTDELKDLKPVDLFDLSLRRDYAAGRIGKVKTAFMRAMSLLIVGVISVFPACTKPADDAPAQRVPTAKVESKPAVEPTAAEAIRELQILDDLVGVNRKFLEDSKKAREEGLRERQNVLTLPDVSGVHSVSGTGLNKVASPMSDATVAECMKHASALIDSRQYEEAIAELTAVINSGSSNPYAYGNRGIAYLKSGQYDSAIKDFNKAIELNPEDAIAYSNLGGSYLQLKDYSRSVAYCEKALELKPNHANSYMIRGTAYLRLGQFDKASADFDKALEFDPNLKESVELSKEEIRKAQETLQDTESSKTEPNSIAEKAVTGNNGRPVPVDYKKRGIEYVGSGQYDLAITELTKAIELDPRDPGAYSNRGAAYVELGEPDKAILDLTKAIELDAKDVGAYTYRGLAYGMVNQPDNAIADYNMAIELGSKDALVYSNRGVEYLRLNQYSKALMDLTKAIELDPNFAPSYVNRGILNMGSGQYYDAIADFTKAIELDPKDAPRAYSNRGEIYRRLGQEYSAISDFNRSIELDPKYGTPYYNRGLTYFSLRQYDKAEEDLDRALVLKPDLREKIDALKKEIRQKNVSPVGPSSSIAPSTTLPGAMPALIMQTVMGAAETPAVKETSGAKSAAVANDTALAKEIEQLIPQLGDPKLEINMAAQQRLEDIGDPAVEPLIRALADKNSQIHYRAQTALVRINTSLALERLTAALNSKNEEVVKTVSWILGQKKDSRAIDSLIKKLGDENFSIRDAASKALAVIGEPAVLPLIVSLGSYNKDVRGSAAMAFWYIKDPRATESLVKMLGDESDDVRNYAARALMNIGKPAIESLLKALRSEDVIIRRYAAKAIAINDPRVIDPLIEALYDNDALVVQNAVISLGIVGDERAIEPLSKASANRVVVERAIKDIKSRLKPASPVGPSSSVAPSMMPGTIPVFLMQAIMGATEVEGDAGQGAAGATGTEEPSAADIEKTVAGLLEKIKGLSNDDPNSTHIYQNVIDSFVRLGKSAVPVLVKAFNNENENVRICAVRTLGIMKAEEAKEPLTRLLSHGDMVMRVTAAMALAKFGGSDVLESISVLLEDKDDTVRLTAALLLGINGDGRGADILISALGDAKEGMLTSIIQTLGRLKEKRALEPLKRMLPGAGLELRNLLIETISNIEGTGRAPKDEDGTKKPGTTKPSERGRGRIVLGSGTVTNNGIEVAEVLWMAGNGLVSNAEARAKLDKLIPAGGFTRQERDSAIDALLGHATSFMLLGMASKTSPAHTQPSADDINEIAAKIQGLDIEVYLPATHLIKNSTGQFRRTMEAVFGDRLTVYQDVQDLPRLIKNPGKAIVMTVDLKESDVAILEKAKQAFEGARFMNFEAMKDMEKMSDQEYHNYIAEILGMLLVARTITVEEARDKSSRSYRMLAHLLEEYLQNDAEMDNYITTLVDGSIDPIAKMRYIIKAILKAMPISVYKAMQPAVEILWSA
ncbi:MAG: tetratricopeptide repeat protein [Candidatus Omnitrophica bacterium]|nr:tetratricopeptide repeat protein [Candidatus Omnitrophota bacterium]